ncbi:MAG: LppX_LprAFG lipoprotein [Dehalococcoidia bacterium]
MEELMPDRARRLARLLVVALHCSRWAPAVGGTRPRRRRREPPPDPATLLRQAADRMEQVQSFHYVLDHERGVSPIVLGLTMSRAEGDAVRPDKLRADVDAAAFGGVNLKLKLVSIGAKTSITNPFDPSKWQELPTGTKLSDVFDPANGTTAALRNVKNPVLAGEETINGVKVWRVEGTVDAAALGALATVAETGYTAKTTAWIGQNTPNLHRVRLEGQLGTRDTADVVRRLELSRFDESITITAPPS